MPKLHAGELELDDGVVRRLVDTQFPQWRSLPLRRFDSTGTVNAIYRLGDDLSVRLPRVAKWAEMVEREIRWLPVLAPRLPLPVPEPVGVGVPTVEFPLPWAVFRWLDGSPWRRDDVDDPSAAAETLADFVLSLERIDTSGAPRPLPGQMGGPVRERDAVVRRALDAARSLIDTGPVRRAWEAVLDVPDWHGPPTWVHADLLPGNVLVRSGRLHAVIDFGIACAGDPAADAVAAWSLFDRSARRAFRSALGADDATWERARGWSLAAVEGIVYYAKTNPRFAAECRARVEAALER